MNRRGFWQLTLVAATLTFQAARLLAQGLPEALEAIERARITTRILYVTAHPDDEPGSVLSYLARGLGADVALLCITRGEGGQNALGPEQGAQLGLLRTEELLAAARVYGVRLFFTRASDFGYSKTPEETLRVWGDVALQDMVRVMRTFRPHVVVNHWGGVRGGHGNHQAAGLLVPRALALLRKEGDAFWESEVELFNLARGGASGSIPIPSNEVSPLWGKTYNEIGVEGFVNHRTQGIVGFRTSPFFRGSRSLVRAEGEKVQRSKLVATLAELAPQVKGDAQGLKPADQAIQRAHEAALRLDWVGAVRALAEAGRKIDELISYFRKDGKLEAEARLHNELLQMPPKIHRALALAAALQIEAQADRSELVAGENFTVQVSWQLRTGLPIKVEKAALVLPEGWSVTKEEVQRDGSVHFTVTVPHDAKAPDDPHAWMPPFPSPLVRARLELDADGYRFASEEPAVHLRMTSTRVDTRPLTLAPAVTLALEPRQIVVVQARPPKQLELLARVHCYSGQTLRVAVGVEAPAGWQVSSPVPLDFSGPGDQLARFWVTPPAKIAGGKHTLPAYARRNSPSTTAGDEGVFRSSLEPLPTLPTRLWSEPAAAALDVLDVAVPEGLRVGYVAAENDPIPAALSQLGVHVELLDPVALAFGDLRRFDAIAIGIRAYELRDDLARANARLLEYAAAGGTLVVQYQREYVWSSLKPAPYPASIGSPTVRITDETSPVRFVAPDHAVLNFPNKIRLRDFDGWIQERGLYFWSQWDPRYQPILALRDPGEEETAGGLLYARVGQGVYIYTGLAFFRQLPEGVSGAYRLFVNLLSQSRARAGK